MSPIAGCIVTSVDGEEDVSIVLLRVGEEADRAGLGPVDRARAMTAASELVRNILKYAGRGTLSVRTLQDGRRSGLEIVAEDHGPGIPDTEAALTDHFSTGGTLGLGLPGVRRMMDEFEMRSAPGEGTRVAVRKWVS